MNCWGCGLCLKMNDSKVAESKVQVNGNRAKEGKQSECKEGKTKNTKTIKRLKESNKLDK